MEKLIKDWAEIKYPEHLEKTAFFKVVVDRNEDNRDIYYNGMEAMAEIMLRFIDDLPKLAQPMSINKNWKTTSDKKERSTIELFIYWLSKYEATK